MLLTIDLGNSNIVNGVFKDQQLQGVWRLPTDQTKSSDEYRTLYVSCLSKHDLRVEDISACIISSVVPPLIPTLKKMIESLFHCPFQVVSTEFPFGLSLLYDNPKELGIDRLVNAAAAFDRYRRNLVIVDLGTMTTICAVTEKGEYLGGAIAPGMKSASDSMHSQTAQLPKIELTAPNSVIGTTTIACMQSGLIYGFTGLVDALVTRFELTMEKKPFVIATGGLVSLIAPLSRTIQEVRPHLTLEGLELLHRRMHLSCG